MKTPSQLAEVQMHCFDLTDEGFTEGLQVCLEPEPCIPVTVCRDTFFPLVKSLGDAILKLAEVAPERLPIVMGHAKCSGVSVAPPSMGDALTLMEGPKGKEALIRVNVSAAKGGRVFLTASNDRGEKAVGDAIVRSFGEFPPLGVSTLGQSWPRGQRPWEVGAQRLELAIVMMKGAAFRIYRSVPPRGVSMTSYVSWNGTKLDMTRNFNTNQRPVVREQLMAAAE